MAAALDDEALSWPIAELNTDDKFERMAGSANFAFVQSYRSVEGENLRN